MQQNGAYGSDVNKYVDICAQRLQSVTGMSQDSSQLLAKGMLQAVGSSSGREGDTQAVNDFVKKIAELEKSNAKFLHNKRLLQDAAEMQAGDYGVSSGRANEIADQAKMLSGADHVSGAMAKLAGLKVDQSMTDDRIEKIALEAVGAVDDLSNKLNEAGRYTNSYVEAGMIPHFDVDKKTNENTITWSRSGVGSNVIPISPHPAELLDSKTPYGRYASVATNAGRSGDGDKRHMDSNIAIFGKSCNIGSVSANIMTNISDAATQKHVLLDKQAEFLDRLSQDEGLRDRVYKSVSAANLSYSNMANDKADVDKFAEACRSAGLEFDGSPDDNVYNAASLIRPYDISSPDALSKTRRSIDSVRESLTDAIEADAGKAIYPCVSSDGTKVGYTVVDRSESGLPVPSSLESLKYISSNILVGGIDRGGGAYGLIKSRDADEKVPAALGSTMSVDDINVLTKLTSNIYAANAMAVGGKAFNEAAENLSISFQRDKDQISESYRRAYGSAGQAAAIRDKNSPIPVVALNTDFSIEKVTHEEMQKPGELNKRISEMEAKFGLPTGSLYDKTNPVGAVVGDQVLSRDMAHATAGINAVNKSIAEFNESAKTQDLSKLQPAFQKKINNINAPTSVKGLASLSMQNAVNSGSKSMLPVSAQTVHAAAEINATDRGMSGLRPMSKTLTADVMSPEYEEERRMQRFADIAYQAGLTDVEAEKMIETGAFNDYVDSSIDEVSEMAHKRLAVADLQAYSRCQNGELAVDKLGYKESIADIDRQRERDGMQHEVDQEEAALYFNQQRQKDVLSLSKDRVSLDQAESYQESNYENQVKKAQIEEQGRSMDDTAKYKKDSLDRVQQRVDLDIKMKKEALDQSREDFKKYGGGLFGFAYGVGSYMKDPNKSILTKGAIILASPLILVGAVIGAPVAEIVSKATLDSNEKAYAKAKEKGRNKVEKERNKLYGTKAEDVDGVEGKEPSVKVDRAESSVDTESIDQMAARLSCKAAKPIDSQDLPTAMPRRVNRPYSYSNLRSASLSGRQTEIQPDSLAMSSSGAPSVANPEAERLKQMYRKYRVQSNPYQDVTRDDLVENVASQARSAAEYDGLSQSNPSIGAAVASDTASIAPSQTPSGHFTDMENQRRNSSAATNNISI